jgi:hypothetical protein
MAQAMSYAPWGWKKSRQDLSFPFACCAGGCLAHPTWPQMDEGSGTLSAAVGGLVYVLL